MKEMKVVLVFFIFIVLFCNVSAFASVSPASYTLDFEPGMTRELTFSFNFGPGGEADLEVYGDLKQYVRLDKTEIVGAEQVTAYLDFPSKIEIPGKHLIRVAAKSRAEGEGFALVADVRAIINILIPYPGKYAELELTTTNANIGEPVNFELIIFNKGGEPLSTTTSLDIFNDNGEVETLYWGAQSIEASKNEKLSEELDTIDYKPGGYNVTAIVGYGGDSPATDGGFFSLGELNVGIINTSNYFEEDTINRFEINVESFWNDEIENLYAKVNVSNYDIEFSTPSINLAPWEKTKLVGYLETKDIESKNFQANVSLHYEGKVTSKIVKLTIGEPEGYNLYLWIGGIIFAIILLIVVIYIIRKKGGKKNQKK